MFSLLPANKYMIISQFFITLKWIWWWVHIHAFPVDSHRTLILYIFISLLVSGKGFVIVVIFLRQ